MLDSKFKEEDFEFRGIQHYKITMLIKDCNNPYIYLRQSEDGLWEVLWDYRELDLAITFGVKTEKIAKKIAKGVLEATFEGE